MPIGPGGTGCRSRHGVTQQFVHYSSDVGAVERMLLMSLPRLAISGGADGGRLIFLLCLVQLFFLGVLLFHPLISLSAHFFEVVVRITRVPS
jgi:hypothetical protein